jgi:hypothetical protein
MYVTSASLGSCLYLQRAPWKQPLGWWKFQQICTSMSIALAGVKNGWCTMPPTVSEGH